jgi:hypothetical protein
MIEGELTQEQMDWYAQHAENCNPYCQSEIAGHCPCPERGTHYITVDYLGRSWLCDYCHAEYKSAGYIHD